MGRSARLARSPLAYWLVVAVLALLTGMVAARVVGNAGALAARYGPLRPVVVATHPLEPGDRRDGRRRRRPPAAGLRPPRRRGGLDRPGRGTGRGRPRLPRCPDGGGPARARRAGGASPPSFPPAAGRWRCPTGVRASPSSGATRSTCWPRSTTWPTRPRAPRRPSGSPPTPWWSTSGDESAAVAVTPEEAARVAFALASGVVTLALAGARDPDPDLSGSSSPAAPAPPAPPPPGR